MASEISKETLDRRDKRTRRYFLIFAITYFFYGVSLMLLKNHFWSSPSLEVLFQFCPRQVYGIFFCSVAIGVVLGSSSHKRERQDYALIAMTILAAFWFAGQLAAAISDVDRLRAGGILLWVCQIALHINMLGTKSSSK